MDDPSPTRGKRKHFSMLRTFAPADAITLGNGCCGAGSILALMQYIAWDETRWLWLAMALLPVALVLDFADGRVARWRHHSSALGADLDSLADVISFGMAPAALGFAVGLRGAFDVAILLYFVGCGISRLARFNVTAEALADESGKVKYFEGTPIPTTVVLVLLIAWFTAEGWIGERLPLGRWVIGTLGLHPFALCYAASGTAMVSATLRIPKP
jgi:CDP-diacylglycerol--serine O-phosphatidyltransferase